MSTQFVRRSLHERSSVTISVPPPPSTFTPRSILTAFVPLVALSEAVFVLTVMRNQHSHPHSHEERFMWQTNLFLNLIAVYLSFEVASPFVLYLVVRFGGALYGILCQYVYACLWSFSMACTIPVLFYAASGDIHVPRGSFPLLYIGLSILFVTRVWLFVDSVRLSSV